MTSRSAVLASTWAALALLACRSEPPPLEPRTTSGEIALHNLESDLRQTERRLAEGDASQALRLTKLLMRRAEFLGRLTDYQRALSVAETFAAATGTREARLGHAVVLARLHRFDEAAAELSSLGDGDPEATRLHASIAAETGGRIEKVAEARSPSRGPSTFDAEIARGALLLPEDPAAALVHFERARTLYGDVSPFPMAWLEFQEGLAHEKLGDLDRAAERWARALRRLPSYAYAASHLSEVMEARGEFEEAERLLRSALVTSEDPEHEARLARVLEKRGRADEGRRRLEAAKAAHLSLVRAEPRAFLDHAVEYWSGPGGDEAFARSLEASAGRPRSTRR